MKRVGFRADTSTKSRNSMDLGLPNAGVAVATSPQIS